MAREDRKILVVGATGHQGGAVARELLARDFAVHAMTRHPQGDPARELAGLGARVVQADLDDPASLEPALAGMWGVYSVQNTWEAGVAGEEEQGKRLARLAREAGVRHFVQASVGSADRDTGIPHFDNKFRIEQEVRGLGFPGFVILRPVFFMENFLSPWFRPGIDEGKLAISLDPATTLQMIAVRDIGRYGAWAFAEAEKLNGRAIDIAGDARTMPEAARIIGEAAGREVDFAPPPIAEVRKASEDFAVMLEWFDRVGYDADIAARSRESGIEPTRLPDWAAEVDWRRSGEASS